jgi:hypothetical protein
MSSAYRRVHLDALDAIVSDDPAEPHWKPLRHSLGVLAFGVNAWAAARAGDVVIEDHDEADSDHEELYVVLRGGARFTIATEAVPAPAGTCLFVPDPATRRTALALEDDTIVLAIGAPPGRAFEPSAWETSALSARATPSP